jgi:hypothetical protein
MDYITELNIATTKVQAQLDEKLARLKELETEFSDTKLNPYGITTIDFSERQELLEDTTKMQGPTIINSTTF